MVSLIRKKRYCRPLSQSWLKEIPGSNSLSWRHMSHVVINAQLRPPRFNFNLICLCIFFICLIFIVHHLFHFGILLCHFKIISQIPIKISSNYIFSTRERCSHIIQQNQLKIVNQINVLLSQRQISQHSKNEFLKTTLILIFYIHFLFD